MQARRVEDFEDNVSATDPKKSDPNVVEDQDPELEESDEGVTQTLASTLPTQPQVLDPLPGGRGARPWTEAGLQLQPSASAKQGVRLQAPARPTERKLFHYELQRLGLLKAAADGLITEAEAADVGIALSSLQAAAKRQNEASIIDSYQEVLALKSTQQFRKVDVTDLQTPTDIDYLVVVPKSLQAQVVTLLEHRSLQGHRVAIVDPDQLAEQLGVSPATAVARFASVAHQKWGTLRFMLLVGTPSLVPPHITNVRNVYGAMLKGSTLQDQFVLNTDHPYSDFDGDGIPEIAVGRLPVADGASLEQTLRKIIAHDTADDEGTWQTRGVLVDGDPGFGKRVDRYLAKLADKEMRRTPPAADFARVSQNPLSPIGVGHDRSEYKLANEGVLLFAYNGHGCVDVIPGLHTGSGLARLAPKQGNPIVVISACLTGSLEYDSCLAGELVTKGQAVAAIGSTTYSGLHNPSWTRILGEEIAVGDKATIGEVMMESKRRLAGPAVAGPVGRMQKTGDAALAVVGLFTPKVGNPKLAHLYMYNLFGDPATPVKRPVVLGAPQVRSVLKPGAQAELEVCAPGDFANGTAHVTLEVPPGYQKRPLEPVKLLGQADERRKRNAMVYNDRAVLRVSLPVREGRLTAPIQVPMDCQPGTYNLRVVIVGDGATGVGVTTGVQVHSR